jgi:hypothetical protein
LGTATPESTLHVEGNVYASSNLEVGGANLFVDTQTSRVGLGTRTPEATLHVEGNVYASSNLEVGGANLFVDTQTSRVGVGTRTPEATLHVEGNVYVSSNLEVGGANLFVDTQTSRVGLGTRTPESTLHVEGNVYVSSNLEVDGSTISGTIVSDQVPNVSWAKSIGNWGSDSGYGIATDSSGNVYVVGKYYDTVDFGPSTSLTHTFSTDSFVAKYDTSGKVLWATSIGGTSAEYGFGIATDSAGNVYVTGYYSGEIIIGSTTLTNAGSSDAFVAKYDTSGIFEWAKSIGGTGSEFGQGIATDSAGNVYVTGRYSGTAYFEPSTSLSSVNGSIDVFVAKYDTSGIFEWAKSIGGTSFDFGNGIAADSAGNVYVTGYYQGAITIGPNTSLTNAGNNDAFIVKYDTSGEIEWARRISGPSSEFGNGIATDSDGNVYVTGRYESYVDFEPNTRLTSTASSDGFVAKYDTSGTFQWAKSISGSGFDVGFGIATGSAGNVYVTGLYEGGVTIGPSTSLTGVGGQDTFVVKYDTSGTVQWATSISGGSNIEGSSISVDSRENVYVTGNYVGSFTIGSTTLTNAGNNDVFIVKYSPDKYLHINTGLEVGTANLFVDTVSGRVGIGTSTPGYTLDVQGDLYVSGTLTYVSDKRLKSNVHVIENALEKVGKLSGYTFTMNNKQNAGVIAQEVLEVLPEVVGGSEETTYSVAYGNMASLFIEAIKELKREIEVLKTKD